VGSQRLRDVKLLAKVVIHSTIVNDGILLVLYIYIVAYDVAKENMSHAAAEEITLPNCMAW
jgi:hypothetical protein